VEWRSDVSNVKHVSFQVDLEPNGRLHVVIKLDGTASEGNKINCLSSVTRFDYMIILM